MPKPRDFFIIVVLLLSLSLPSLAQRWSAETHIVRPGQTLGWIARIYDVDIFELAALNGINNAHRIYSWQELQLPSQSAAAQSTSQVRGEHVVKRGETLGSIADFYGIDLFELQRMNGIYHAWIYPGDKLHLPVPGPVETAPTVEETAPASAAETSAPDKIHIIKPGETLGEIAMGYGISLNELMRRNNVWSALIYPGQELSLPADAEWTAPEPTPEAAPDEAPASIIPEPAPVALPDTHIVQRGETLFRIATLYGVTVDALMRANGIVDAGRIHSGLELRVRNLESYAAPAPPSPSTSAVAPAPAPAQNANRQQYTVQPGDILSQIGAKFGMNWLAIAAINGIGDPDRVHVGAVLQIPTRAEAERYGPVRSTNYGNFYSSNFHPGPRVGVGKELVVVLSSQTAYAYQDGVLQRRALISSGLPDTPTVRGDYKIYLKRRLRHMVGDDYDLPDVPWVMYFYQGYAFHGTYWHNNFGTPMSHGCVNMTNADAKWFYEFAPIGTPVYVRY